MTEKAPDAGRLTSLDAFRGMAIAGMILVNNPGSWSHVYPPLRHAEWHGWTPTDLIFPFFLFIVGVAVPFSFSKRLERGSGRGELFGHVVRRSAILVGLGLFMAGFPRFELATIRIPGVLQRIGVVYLGAAGLYLVLRPAGRAVVGAALLLGYWAVMTLVAVPGHGAGDLSPEGNLAAYLDRTLLGDHLWAATGGTWDPEGLLSTFPAVVTALLGIHAGEWLRREGRGRRTAGVLVAAGGLGVGMGLLWDLAFPINKNLWTSSYVLFTGGVAALVLGGLHWIVDVRSRDAWSRPFVHYGMNAIAVFVASGLVTKSLVLLRTGAPAGGGTSAYHRIYEVAFASWAGPLNGSLAFALAHVLFWYGVAALLYRKRIFIKI